VYICKYKCICIVKGYTTLNFFYADASPSSPVAGKIDGMSDENFCENEASSSTLAECVVL
jgi:hypothetical protein